MKSIERIRAAVVSRVMELCPSILHNGHIIHEEYNLPTGQVLVRGENGFFSITSDGDDGKIDISLSFTSNTERYGNRWLSAALLLGVPINDRDVLLEQLLEKCKTMDDCDNDTLSGLLMEIGEIVQRIHNERTIELFDTDSKV